MSADRASTGGAGRPRSEAKRAAILDAAGTLFLTQGPENTSMDAVAREANVSKQTVYSHFGDKDSLFAACIQSKVSSYRVADLPDLIDLDLRAALLELGHRFMDLLMDKQVVAMFRVVIGASASHPHIGALFYDNGPRRTIDALAALLDHHARAGTIDCSDTREAAAIFLDLLAAHLQRRMLLAVDSAPSKAAQRAQIERTVDRFLRLFAREE